MFKMIARRMRAGLAGIFGPSAGSTVGRNYRDLLLSGAWYGPVDGGIYNYLPVFLARLGASPSLVSLLTAGPSLVAMLAYIPGGAYAERYSNQAKLFARAALLSRTVYVLIALLPLVLAPAEISWVTVVVWSLAIIPNAVAITAWTTALQQAVPVAQRARLNGERWALAALTSSISILLFGLLIDHTPFPIGYQLVFLASFGATVLNLHYFSRLQVPPLVASPEPVVPGPRLTLRLQEFLRPFAESRPFIRYNVANVAFRLMLTLPAGLYSIYWVQGLRATDTWIGLRGTVGFAALVAGYWFWGRMANRMGHRTLLLVCGAAQACYPVLTALAPTTPWLLPAAALWGFTLSGLELGLIDTLLAVCPAGRQPRFAGVANTLTSIAVSIGPLLGAALAQVTDIRTALLLAGAFQLASAFTFRLMPSRQQEQLGMQ